MNAKYERALGQNIRALRMKKGFSQEQLFFIRRARMFCPSARSYFAFRSRPPNHCFSQSIRNSSLGVQSSSWQRVSMRSSLMDEVSLLTMRLKF